MSQTVLKCDHRMMRLAWGEGTKYFETFGEGPHTAVEYRLLEQYNRSGLQQAIQGRKHTIMAIWTGFLYDAGAGVTCAIRRRGESEKTLAQGVVGNILHFNVFIQFNECDAEGAEKGTELSLDTAFTHV